MNFPLNAQIEAVLFWKAEPVSIKKLAAMLGAEIPAVENAVSGLETSLKEKVSGLVLIRREDEVSLGTHPELSKVIEGLVKEELQGELGKASLETLSIILYRGPVARRDIDYIRGVNSQFILRALQVRGLIEKMPNPADQRTFIYKPTLELLSYLGLSRIEDLPEYQAVQGELTAEKIAANKNETET